MNFEDRLFHLGVASFITEIITPYPATPQQTFQIGKTLSQDVGFIYGLQTYADGVDVANTALPSTTQCQNTFVLMKNGSTNFMEPVRLDDLLCVFSGIPEVRNSRYVRMNIPRFDISSSQYLNPTMIVGPINIHLRLWYIQANDWKRIEKEMFSERKNKMFFSIDKYIYRQYPKAYFEEVAYEQSVNGIIQQTYGEQSPKGFLYHYIYWVPEGAGIATTFTDQFGKVLFVAQGTTNWAPLPLVAWGIDLVINSSNKIVFSVSFQKIMA